MDFAQKFGLHGLVRQVNKKAGLFPGRLKLK